MSDPRWPKRVEEPVELLTCGRIGMNFRLLMEGAGFTEDED